VCRRFQSNSQFRNFLLVTITSCGVFGDQTDGPSDFLVSIELSREIGSKKSCFGSNFRHSICEKYMLCEFFQKEAI
jgi:hypothetical protein